MGKCELLRISCVVNKWHQEIPEIISIPFCNQEVRQAGSWGDGDRTCPRPCPRGSQHGSRLTRAPACQAQSRVFSLGLFQIEAWPGVCPALQPRQDLCQGCSVRTGGPWPLVPMRWPRPCHALAATAGSVMSTLARVGHPAVSLRGVRVCGHPPSHRCDLSAHFQTSSTIILGG